MSTIENFCLFIGFERTGHSIIGALLDAHPEIVIPHEYNVFKHFKMGKPKKILLMELIANAHHQAGHGRGEGRYSYSVENQSQGSYTTLKVIGDKKGKITTQYIMNNPEILEAFRNEIKLPIMFIHVIRHPLDTIATVCRYIKKPLSPRKIQKVIDEFFIYAEANEKIRQSLQDPLFTLYHEDFIENPAHNLKNIIRFLGVEWDEQYISDCTSIVRESPNQSRSEIELHETTLDFIRVKSNSIPHLNRYRI